MEQGIEKGKETYRLLFENAAEAIGIYSPWPNDGGDIEDLIINDVNPAYLSGLNIRREEVVGKRMSDLIGRDVLKPYLNMAAGICADNRPKTFETYFAPLQKYYLVTVCHLGDALYASLAVDITERKKTEDALHGAKKKYKDLVDGITTFIIVIDTRGVVNFANRYALEFFGYREDEFLQRNFVGTIIPEKDSAGKDMGVILAAAIKNPEEYSKIECENMKKNGERVWVQWTNKAIRDQEGNLTEILVAGSDITHLKWSEDLLRRHEIEFRTLVQNSPDIILRFDRNLRHLYVNPAVEQITGIPPDTFIGKTDRELGMPEEREAYWRSVVEMVFRTGYEQRAEFDFPGIYGNRYFLGRVIPEFVSKEGVVESVMVIARDITERKRVEEQVRYISFHDQPTGLFNRNYFEEELRRIDTERELPISLIMGDINNLKLVNDAFGHQEGDMLLLRIADILRASCRATDIIARWGGDEFVVILPRTDEATAAAIAERITHGCSEIKNMTVQPAISLGVAAKMEIRQNLYRVLRQAEEMMYNKKVRESNENQEKVIASLLAKVSEKIPVSVGHVERLQQLISRVGGIMGLSSEQMNELTLLVAVHEVGKVMVPDAILQKTERLTPEEWIIVKRHSESGYHIARSSSRLMHLAETILSNHERWDGKGYPKGLQKDEIPFLSRVIAILDAYDCMTHTRPYGAVYSREKALEEILQNVGTQFDPALAETFVNAIRRAEPAGTGE